jgi:hypothetical protein
MTYCVLLWHFDGEPLIFFDLTFGENPIYNAGLYSMDVVHETNSMLIIINGAIRLILLQKNH